MKPFNAATSAFNANAADTIPTSDDFVVASCILANKMMYKDKETGKMAETLPTEYNVDIPSQKLCKVLQVELGNATKEGSAAALVVLGKAYCSSVEGGC